MSTIAHPDAALEETHLQSTLTHIAEETAVIEAAEATGREEVRQQSIQAGSVYSNDLVVAMRVYEHKAQTLHNLHLAKNHPYFTRVDFIPDGEKEKKIYYIGKWGVMRASTYEQIVIDWRAPVANLYYSGQVGRMQYVAPDGEVRGELTLKRQLGIEEGKLETIFDTDVVSKDAYLQSVLGAVSSEHLREVVSTIQAEQNVVIRFPPDLPLMVQGVAGSGKTTIALHRIAYLLYAFQDQLAPANMMIIAPNPLFLDYISAVLPDLGVDQVVQTTFPLLAARWLGKQMPKLRREDTFEDMLSLSPDARKRETAVLRYMGSLRFADAIRAYIDALELRIVPEGDVKFGPVTLYSNAQMQDIFQVELKPFAFKKRMTEIPKYLKGKMRRALEQTVAWLMNETDRRADEIAEAMPDGPERRARMKTLYDSRNDRLKEAEERAKSFSKTYLESWPKLALLDVYRDFWETERDVAPEDAETYAEARKRALARIEEKKLAPGDIAPMLLLAWRIEGFPHMDIRHIVIDEAQDFSPFQFQLLRDVMHTASFTIVGDLMQGVHAYEGLRDWDEVKIPVFGGNARMRLLRTSYRNTVEIMAFASRVPKRHPTPGQVLAQPVLRHGPEPEIVTCLDEKARNAALAERARALLDEGFHSVAIIARRAQQAKAIHKAMPTELQAKLLRPDDASFSGGVLVMPSSLVKGLEFDAVLMADVSETEFADTLLDARLLYVCLTRPLHRLTCYTVGACSALLAEETETESHETA